MADFLHFRRRFAWLQTMLLVGLVADLTSCVAQSPIAGLAFTKDFQHVITGSQHGIGVAEWPRLVTVEKTEVELDNIHDIAVSPDGKHVLIAGGTPGSSGVVQLRSWPELDLKRIWTDHDDVVYQVDWRDDGQEWISAAWDGYARVSRLTATQPHVESTNHSGPVFAATYLADKTVATAGADRTIAVWNSETGDLVRVLRQHTGTVHALALQPDSPTGQERYLASASEDRTVRFWQPNLGRMVRFQRFPSVPRSIAWSKDGTWLVVGCDDGHVIRLDPVSLQTYGVTKVKERVLNIMLGPADGTLCLSFGEQIIAIELQN